jgi:hypothetical protein
MKFKIGIGGLFFKLKIRPLPCFFSIGGSKRFANMVSKLSFPRGLRQKKNETSNSLKIYRDTLVTTFPNPARFIERKRISGGIPICFLPEVLRFQLF